MKEESQPQYMITYLCTKCELDFAMTEKNKPKCFSCGSTKNMVILKKEKLSPKVMTKRLKLVSERMVENLKKAWEYLPKENSKQFDDEKTLLKIMTKAKKLSKEIKKLKLKREIKLPPPPKK